MPFDPLQFDLVVLEWIKRKLAIEYSQHNEAPENPHEFLDRIIAQLELIPQITLEIHDEVQINTLHRHIIH